MSSKAVPFFTAWDIALAEYEADRMTAGEAWKVANAIIKERNVGMLFPHYALCPADYEPCGAAPTDVMGVCQDVRLHVRTLCRQQKR